MRDVLRALDYMHHHEGIHRDVKADNILLHGDGSVTLTDFGVSAASRHDPISVEGALRTGVMARTFVGTPCWMAPEVMEQTAGYDSSADIWSFGITLVEMARGKPPLARMPPMQVLLKTLRDPAPTLDGDARFSKVCSPAWAAGPPQLVHAPLPAFHGAAVRCPHTRPPRTAFSPPPQKTPLASPAACCAPASRMPHRAFKTWCVCV